jgi:pyruvate kinase
MRRNRKAKIVATLGPVSSDLAIIRELFNNGVDVFRLNFSHGTHEDHKKRVEIIRELEQEVGRPIGILMDIQGPKLRLGKFREDKANLKKGRKFRLDMSDELGGKRRASLPHPEIFAALKPGSEVVIDDGRVRLEVIDCGGDHVETRVVVGGVVSNNKGVNVPDVILPISVLTEKDKRDLDYGLKLNVDWVAQSFVQQPADVMELREIVGDQAKIMVKLEKPSALEKLDDILETCDGIMVARGDLGVELPPQQVPVAQKKIIRRCRAAGKPVVVATHMLESMVTNPVPTRAEASDVATAVYDGADAVMLSAESAAGEYPVRSVKMMNDIIEEVECDPAYPAILDSQRPQPDNTTADAICNGLQSITNILSSAATVTYTASGSTTLRAARERPHAPILSLTPLVETARHLSIAWGVHAVTVDVAKEAAEVDDVINEAKAIAVRECFAGPGEAVVIAAGLPFGTSGTTNLLHVAWLD